VTYSMHKHVHQVEVIVRSNGERYAGKVESENMYASVDMVVHKLERQVRDRKDHGARERRQGKSVRDGVELMPDPAEEPGG
jgi:ribosomal subunit interface protein